MAGVVEKLNQRANHNQEADNLNREDAMFLSSLQPGGVKPPGDYTMHAIVCLQRLVSGTRPTNIEPAG